MKTCCRTCRLRLSFSEASKGFTYAKPTPAPSGLASVSVTLGIPPGAGRRSVLIANPNSNPSTTDVLVDRLSRWMTVFASGVDIPAVLGVTAKQGPEMITTPQALTDAARHVCEVVGDAVDRHRLDAVVVGAFGDPGVEHLRGRLDIPVIGIGEAAVRDASRSATRFGIATTTGDLVQQLVQMVDSHALADVFTGVEVTDTGPLRLAAQPDESLLELADAVQRACSRGAEKVIIGGGPLSSASDNLEQLFPGVIVDPVNAAARWAEQVTRPRHLQHQDEKALG
ncbi:aspartate/glutamate racemase family protein [Mycobacterium sp. 236(2023)]|uniref:aspartate/glutamate racemase family protein n=1 Tax=Mycobacterium sp. 236(2023) TaxID=3038163 RepID=UPI0024150DF7|nr:aspartate/glutamate racemase family protein [Mycobacterium sp. 236(2023)]MDG4667190.1 aspartate/glutamate racemase family protein [Mycobacterium sp. 236(2023)]